MDTALVVTWQHPVPGREQQALDHAPDTQQLNTKGMLLLAGYRWSFGVTGSGADAFMLRYAAAAKELSVL